MESGDREMDLIRQETETIMKAHETKLANVCRDMCGAVDERSMREHADDVALQQSKQRIAEQNSMAKQLINKSHGLQGSIDKTVRKFDEVSSSYATVQKELARRQACKTPVPGDADLSKAMSHSQRLMNEMEQEERDLAMLKSYLDKSHADLTAERQHSNRLEDF